MNLLVTGICGFVGTVLTRALIESIENLRIFGADNFTRPGSEFNQNELASLGVKLLRADLRISSDMEMLPPADWVIDAAANPSVLAGVDNKTSSRQLLEHNLWGTVNVLEYCRKYRAGLILLSTSRVYSVKPLAELAVEVHEKAFRPHADRPLPVGLSKEGIKEDFLTTPPVSLYGSSKLASESLAIEYGENFNFPVWVNRCGVLAGAGQFGKSDQGIFSFWLNTHLRRRPLKYIGFGGSGFQVRDCLHPRDLAPLLQRQMAASSNSRQRILNLSGGVANSTSLACLTDWCDARFGRHTVTSDPAPRPFDIPWLVLDCRLACQEWGWKPTTSLEEILVEIAEHAQKHPEWLELTAA
jgi:CDP-paratose 2-epimerase